jgi:hypothetical protein
MRTALQLEHRAEVDTPPRGQQEANARNGTADEGALQVLECR